jgi:nitrous oxidase accessory protein
VTYRPAFLAIVMALTGATVDARTWTVGGTDADFPLIAPAIAAAAGGDTIRVRGGVYREDLLLDKTLALAGEGRPTLFGTGLGSVINITAPGCEVSGFTIEGSGTGETNGMDAAVLVHSNGNRIVDNIMRRVFYGVVVTDATRNEIAGNDIQGLSHLAFGHRGDGVYVYRAPGNVVARNRISGERDGIYFQYAPRGQATDNIVSYSRYGLHDMFSDEAEIAGNTFSDSVVGANIMNSRRIRIERNTIARNRGVPGIGLTLKDCDDSTIRENAIVENARGLLLDGSSLNQFLDNTFRANDTATTLFSSAEQNAFSGNTFVDNWSDLVLSGRDSGTRWAVDGRGNFWSRYRGFDFDGDGIGDAPHPLVGAFERLEGANPAVRIFLQSPAAAGLELAARLSGRASDATDPRPLVRRADRSARAPVRTRQVFAGGLFLLGFAAITIVKVRRTNPCSR